MPVRIQRTCTKRTQIYIYIPIDVYTYNEVILITFKINRFLDGKLNNG